MDKAIKIRTCNEEDLKATSKVSSALLDWLKENGKADYFGGVDEDELRQAMRFPSTVLLAVNEKDEILGFLLLQVPSEQEQLDYRNTFNAPLLRGKHVALILNGYGVKPEFQHNGIAKKMLEAARDYVIENGYYVLIGTVHPKNSASRRSMQHISKNYRESKKYVHKTKDGRKLSRVKFYFELL